MTGLDFLENMNDIDAELLEGSEHYKKKNNVIWIRWAAVAAAFIIVSALAVINPFSKKEALVNTETAFIFNGINYEIAEKEKLAEYGIAADNSRIRTEDEDYIATKADCGKQLGNIDITINGEKINCIVYSHSHCDDSNICVVEYPDEYYRIYVIREE